MFPTIHGILSQLGLSFLLRDDFTTPEAAPIASPRTAEPGPGTLTIIDADNSIDISADKLNWTQWTTSQNGIASTATFSRTAGRAFFAIITHVSGSQFTTGFSTVQNPSAGDTSGLQLRCQGANAAIRFLDTGGNSNLGETWPPSGTPYYIFIIQRATGGFLIDKSGVDWRLLAVRDGGTNSNLYAYIANFQSTAADSDGNADTFRVAQLSAPFNTDSGIATDVHAGNVTAGTTFTHEADCLIEWTQTTVPSAGTQELWFRSPSVGVDGWRVTVDSTGALSLDEVVSSVPTTRGTAAGVIVNGDRIVIVADDETIKVYEANILRITYASAVTNKTATAGELETLAIGGAIADLISWPRVLSGAAKEALDDMAA